MIVLDYPRRVASIGEPWHIVVPPFHTGHLGMMPLRQAHVYLMASTRQVQNSVIQFCDVLITPFVRPVGELVRLECTMDDRMGVVELLTQAVAGLGINIVNADSTVIGHPAQHQVNMIVDMSPSRIGERPPDFSTHRARPLLEYSRCVPVDDYALVELFCAICRACGPALCWDHDSAGKRPRIRLRRIHMRRGIEDTGNIQIKRDESSGFNVRLEVPHSIGLRIRRRLEVDKPQDLSYFLVSETEERSLHAFFFRNDAESKVFHVGVYHDDTPGALAAVLKAVANAGFSIVTSLLRRDLEGKSVWEALLEFRGASTGPGAGRDPVSRLRWVAARLAMSASDAAALYMAGVHVGAPAYPLPSAKMRDQQIPLIRGAAKKCGHPGSGELVSAGRENNPAAPDDNEPRWTKVARRHLAECVGRYSRPPKPCVFISYPGSGTTLAGMLSKALLGIDCDVTNGMGHHGQVILEEIVSRIDQADYFVGIWHYKRGEAESLEVQSPWLPLEYGVALAKGKPLIIVRHESMPVEAWNSIDPSKNKPSFNEETFETSTVPMLLKAIGEHFQRF